MENTGLLIFPSSPRRGSPQQNRKEHAASKKASLAESKPAPLTPLQRCIARIRSAWTRKPPRIVTVRNAERKAGTLPKTRRRKQGPARFLQERPAPGWQQRIGMMGRYLMLVRLEAGDVQLHSTIFSLADAIQQISTPFRQQMHQKGLSFDLVGLPKHDVMVYMDWSFLAHIIQELLANSITYTRVGGVTLTVETQGRTLRLYVSDSGVGIPEAVLPTVFSGRRQVHAAPVPPADALPPARPGTGLPLVWGLVDVMGGHVAVESQAGDGTTFTVTLPDVVTAPR